MGNINASYLGLINGLYLITLIVVSNPVHPPQHLVPEQGPLCAPKTSGDGIRLEVEGGVQRAEKPTESSCCPSSLNFVRTTIRGSD